ncbi:SUKH-4 family immunity protein [Catenulispora pinisilvae]|uniref:SUKH-4 family immunity protein n=1 Tax=Catenulispora pinisilvae TaxID=2705253 RepID=UPI0018911233|nr:SUKH-4 family immunity protein [Catenulispora pinisilvae]
MEPSYRIITIPIARNAPAWVRDEVGPTLAVPAGLIGREYVASDEAELIRDAPAVLAFGQVGLEGRIGVNVATGEIVHAPATDSADLNPVNSTLKQFCECVESVIQRYPFDGAPSADMDEVAEELREELSRIDVVAAAHNGFWETFADDVAMGDYLSET